MDRKALEAFVAVATLGGFTRASQQLHRSQPVISRRIAALEAELGVSLFERATRSVRLTPAGEGYLPHAQLALNALQDGEQALLSPGSLSVSIAAVGTLADKRLTGALKQYRRQQPSAKVELRTATSKEVSLLVVRGEAHFGLRYYQSNDTKLLCEKLGYEQLRLVASPLNALASSASVKAGELQDANFLSFPVDMSVPDSFGLMLQRELLALGLSEPNISFVDSLMAQKRLVEANYGIALLPESACREEIEAGSLRFLNVKQKGFQPIQPVFVEFRRQTKSASFITQLLKAFQEHYVFD